MLLLLLLPPCGSFAQLYIRSSPTYIGTSQTLVLLVGQWDEYNITLTANTPLQFAYPVISGAMAFRISTCQNGIGGFTPTFASSDPNITIVNRVGSAVTTLTAGACDTEYWTYRSLAKQLVLQSVSLNSGGSLAPINSLPNQSGNYNAQGFKIQNIAPGTVVGDALGWGQSNAQVTDIQPGAAVVSSASATNGSQVTSLTISAPAGIVNGNALIAVITLVQGGQAETITWPSGFALVANSQVSTNAGGQTIVQAYACKIAASESGSYAISWNNSAYPSGGIIQVSGISCSNDGTPTSAAGSNGTNLSVPGVVTAQANDFIVDWGSLSNGSVMTSGGRGAKIFSPASETWASSYLNPSGTSPSVVFYSGTTGGAGSVMGEQVSFLSTSTVQQVPILQGSAGNVIQDVTAHVNGVLNVKAPPYNAAFDNVTDDSAAIQKALNDGCTQGKSIELPVGTGRTTVPLFDACANPSDLFGRSQSSSTISAYFNDGPVIIEANPTNDVTLVGPITATSILGGGVALCWDGTNTPCGTATGASPGQYMYDVKDWIDSQGSGDAKSSANPLNGLSAGNLTIDAEVNLANLAQSEISDSNSGVSGGVESMRFGMQSTNWAFGLNMNGTYQMIQSAASTGNHHLAGVLDNHSGNGCATTNCMRLYVDGVQTASLDVTGNVVQPTYDSWVLGASAPHFPDTALNGSDWDGKIDFFRIEQSDLYPSGTTFTPPASKPAGDANTILLINGDKPATIAGFGSTIAANGLVGDTASAGDQNKGGPGVACTTGKCGEWAYIHAVPLSSGGTVSHTVRDMTINNGGESLMGNVAIQFHARNLTLTANHVPYKFFNNSYEEQADDLIITTNGEAGMELSHNSGFINANNLLVNNGTAFDYAGFEGGGIFTGLFLQPQAGSAIADIYLADDTIFGYFECTGCAVDSENQAPTKAVIWNEGENITFVSGDLQATSTSNPFPIQTTAANATSIVTVGTHMEGGGGALNNPMIHCTVAPSANSHLTVIDPIFNGNAIPAQSGVAISDCGSINGRPYVQILANGSSVLANFQGSADGIPSTGSISTTTNTTPSAPTCVHKGTGGATTYTYFVVCHDANSGPTLASASLSCSGSNATLNTTNYNQVSWGPQVSCVTWDLLKTDTAHSLVTGYTGLSYADTGQSTAGYTAPTRNGTADIVAGAGGVVQAKEGLFGACPACAAGTAGTHCSVSDDNTACAFGATVTGSGTHHVDAYCDGTQYVMTECK